MVIFTENLGILHYFLEPTTESGFLKPLDKEKEAELFNLARQGDKNALETLVMHNMRLVVHVAKRYAQSIDQEELISIGSVGLMKAVKTFNIDKGTQFSTYAAKCIDNEILMYLRANKKNIGNVSLFRPIGSDKDGNEISLSDTLFDENYHVGQSIEAEDIKKDIHACMKETLSKREFYIIALRYGLFGYDKLPQREIADRLKISRSYISRIEKKALQKMKAYMIKNNLE